MTDDDTPDDEPEEEPQVDDDGEREDITDYPASFEELLDAAKDMLAQTSRCSCDYRMGNKHHNCPEQRAYKRLSEATKAFA